MIIYNRIANLGYVKKELKRLIPLLAKPVHSSIQKFAKTVGELDIREKMETIQTTALSRSARILRTVKEIWVN